MTQLYSLYLKTLFSLVDVYIRNPLDQFNGSKISCSLKLKFKTDDFTVSVIE